MKSIKHFAYAFLHLFTFVIMMYLYNVMPDFIRQINEPGLWFICVVIIANGFMGGAHLTWFINGAFNINDRPSLTDYKE